MTQGEVKRRDTVTSLTFLKSGNFCTSKITKNLSKKILYCAVITKWTVIFEKLLVFQLLEELLNIFREM